MATDSIVHDHCLGVQVGGQYEVSWDVALPHGGHFLRGVIVREDGPVAARLVTDGLGTFCETAYDADDRVIVPLDGWEQWIKRRVA